MIDFSCYRPGGCWWQRPIRMYTCQESHDTMAFLPPRIPLVGSVFFPRKVSKKPHGENTCPLIFFFKSFNEWGSVQKSILKPCLSPPNNSCSQTYPTWGKAWDTQLLFTLEELGTWGNKITCDSWVLDLNYQPGTPIHRQKKYQLGVPGFYTTEMGLRMANVSCFSLVPINCTLSQILTI